MPMTIRPPVNRSRATRRRAAASALAGAGAGFALDASTTAGEHPNFATSGLDGARSLNRSWTVTSANGGGATWSATYNYPTSDLDGTADPLILLRLFNYPSRPVPAGTDALWGVGEHTDYGLLTILNGENGPGGLQVQTRSGTWIDVETDPDTFVVNIGDLLMRWTNDRWLSNLHLGARDPESGQFVMLGKTFKGLTDAMLRAQTETLLALEERREGHVVHVRPELVVEVAFSDVQESPRYPAGLALRFARVKHHRPEKPAAEADTIQTVQAIFERQRA